MLNGRPPGWVEAGDMVIILAYGHYPDAPPSRLRPKIVRVDRNNTTAGNARREAVLH
jgi:aspartate 1-decarboxylase